MFVLKYGEQPTRCNPILVSMLVEDYDAMIGFFLYKVTWNKEDPRYLMKTSSLIPQHMPHAHCILILLSDLGPLVLRASRASRASPPCQVKYVLNTHCHADHITSGGAIKKLHPEAIKLQMMYLSMLHLPKAAI